MAKKFYTTYRITTEARSYSVKTEARYMADKICTTKFHRVRKTWGDTSPITSAWVWTPMATDWATVDIATL